MRTVALVTQKGGAGKSTLAACLAVAAQEAGQRVFMIDMDQQKSLTKWANRRGDKTLPVECVPVGRLHDALTALARSGVNLVLIDTPAGVTEASEAAMRHADLCLIPTRPTIFDVWASEATRGRLKSLGKEFAFVLNQCPPVQESRRVAEGSAALESLGGLLRPLIASRVIYQEAAREGLGPSELEPAGKASEEMRLFWVSLQDRLSRTRPIDRGRDQAA